MASTLTEEVTSQIKGRLEKIKQGSLVQNMEKLYGFSEENGLMYTQVLSCTAVGIHPSNRDNEGVSAQHVHDLIAKGIVIEVHPGEPGKHIRDFNSRIAGKSQGGQFPLAPCAGHAIRFATVAGSHFTQACKCLFHGVRHRHRDESLNVGGNLNMQRLEQKDAEFARAVKGAVAYKVISWAVVEAFPELPCLAQAAGNASQQIQKSEGELQIASRVASSINAFRKRTGQEHVSWGDVKDDVMRSRPPCSGTVPFLFTFVVKFQGGPDSWIFKETLGFIRSHGWGGRSMGADFWDNLSHECKGLNQRFLWRHMLLKLAFCGPDKIVSASDARRSLTSGALLQKVDDAERVLQKAKEIQKGLGSASVSISD